MWSSTLVDELGYVPLEQGGGADLLFGFISQRYERRSLVVTTNLPFARWSEVFLDPTAAAAVIDRIVHHATVLQTKPGNRRMTSRVCTNCCCFSVRDPTRAPTAERDRLPGGRDGR